jgi:HTH-type transcriptional regulator/antitoxin HipB
MMVLSSAAELGRAIRLAREARGLGQSAAARQAGVSRLFLIQLEHGKASVHLEKTLAVMNAVGLVGIVFPLEVIQGALG